MATDMAAIARSESKWGNLVARAFMRRLLTIVALGLTVRVVYALLAGPDLVLAGDARTFHSLATSIASGHGFVRERAGPPHPHPPAALPALPVALLAGGAEELGGPPRRVMPARGGNGGRG